MGLGIRQTLSDIVCVAAAFQQNGVHSRMRPWKQIMPRTRRLSIFWILNRVCLAIRLNLIIVVRIGYQIIIGRYIHWACDNFKFNFKYLSIMIYFVNRLFTESGVYFILNFDSFARHDPFSPVIERLPGANHHIFTGAVDSL